MRHSPIAITTQPLLSEADLADLVDEMARRIVLITPRLRRSTLHMVQTGINCALAELEQKEARP